MDQICGALKFIVFLAMTPEEGTAKLDAQMKDQANEMVKLQGKLAENKEAAEEMRKTLDNLDAATEKLEKGTERAF